MCDETLEERQNNEFEAIKSIFGDVVVDNREQIAWNVWRPLNLMLTLNPSHSSDAQDIHCSVTLHIQCCAEYPNRPPNISIHRKHGISDDNAEKLLAELRSLAETLCGEVMIFILAQHTEQFLYDHNKPTLSFYEEMVKQKDEMEKLKQHDMEVKENKERQKIKDEIQRRQEILRVAGKNRLHRSSVSQDANDDRGQGDAPELVYYADNTLSPAKTIPKVRSKVPCTCNAKGAQVLRVTQRNNKKVYIGNCLGHSSNGATTYLTIDDGTGERLITKKWSLPVASDFQLRNKQLTALQQDFKSMCRLKHTSITPYTAMEMCKEPSKRTMKQCIYLFRDFIIGTSLKCFKNQLFQYSDRFETIKLLRHVAQGIFSALKELHRDNIIHRDLRSENVFLDELGVVKVVGAGLDSRLAEIIDEDYNYERQTKAQDIYAAAQVLLSIVSKDNNIQDIPSDLPSPAKDFLLRCLTEDEYSQWSADQLVSHAFLVDAPVKQPSEQKDDAGSGSEDEDPVKKIQHIGSTAQGHSRLHAEFEVLAWLGKGAFGDVLKVKNKLDDLSYAIKRIQLNPENVQLNKKITREVKLLSRLNHENVVRYYNAWIESTTDCGEVEETTSVKALSKSPSKKKVDSLEGIVAKLGQEVKVEWSISEGPVQKNVSSDSEDDENDHWLNIINPEDENSGSIEFEVDSNQSMTVSSEDNTPTPRPKSERLTQVLYIQMEFCEKHTLRQAIDNGLYQEHFKAWRLFREIVEGLAHVHQKGMIHRDLKPVNIFLDSNDHVKIGDFGLATKTMTGLLVDEKTKHEDVSGSLTGQVGTALYVAPELLQSTSKVIYNQKVDIYSLGIILFEMFHPPLSTGMERIMVLTDLRSKDIKIPKEFDKEDNAKQIHVIRWLLNHDASLRPTCAELLASEHVPRPIPEGALSGLLSHTLSDRGSRGYRKLVAACLDQRQSAAEDLTYHDGFKTKPGALADVKDTVVKVFRSHGASEFAPPLLIPRVRNWDKYPNAVRVMTSSGTVCYLPHDLRLPFARHTAYNKTKYMRRYVVDRVYRENQVHEFHPREMLECAFDIVTPPTETLWLDAELLVVASRAAQDSNLKVTIQLNHTDMLRTLLLSCGVPQDKHTDMYLVLVDVSFGRITSLQLQTHLTSLCVTNRDVNNLLRLMEADVTVDELRELVSPFVKQAKWGKIVSHAILALEEVYRHAKALGCECPVTVAPFLAYNATQHSGIFWKMSVIRDEQKTGKYRAADLIAAGGRYDALIEEFWNIAHAERDTENEEPKTCAVGFSMSLERMAAILQKMEADTSSPAMPKIQLGLVYICLGPTAARVKLAQVARELWSGGARCGVWPLCPPAAIDHSGAAILLHQDDAHSVLAVCRMNDQIREYKMPFIDVLDFVKQQLNPDTMRSPENSNSRALSWSETEKPSSLNISVTYITASEKMSRNAKRLCENQINNQIASILSSVGLQPALPRARVHAVALACEAQCVRLLAANLTTPLHYTDLVQAFDVVRTAYTKRQNILEEALYALSNLTKQNSQNRNPDEIQLYALYSIPDSLCRIIL